MQPDPNGSERAPPPVEAHRLEPVDVRPAELCGPIDVAVRRRGRRRARGNQGRSQPQPVTPDVEPQELGAGGTPAQLDASPGRLPGKRGEPDGRGPGCAPAQPEVVEVDRGAGRAADAGDGEPDRDRLRPGRRGARDLAPAPVATARGDLEAVQAQARAAAVARGAEDDDRVDEGGGRRAGTSRRRGSCRGRSRRCR